MFQNILLWNSGLTLIILLLMFLASHNVRLSKSSFFTDTCIKNNSNTKMYIFLWRVQLFWFVLFLRKSKMKLLFLLRDVPKRYLQYFMSENSQNIELMQDLKKQIQNSGLEVFDGWVAFWFCTMKEIIFFILVESINRIEMNNITWLHWHSWHVRFAWNV